MDTVSEGVTRAGVGSASQSPLAHESAPNFSYVAALFPSLGETLTYHCRTGGERPVWPPLLAFLLTPFPKVHPLGKSRVPGRGGFACFGLSPPPGQRCDLFYFALESPRCWTGPAAVGLSFQVRLPWV